MFRCATCWAKVKCAIALWVLLVESILFSGDSHPPRPWDDYTDGHGSSALASRKALASSEANACKVFHYGALALKIPLPVGVYKG